MRAAIQILFLIIVLAVIGTVGLFILDLLIHSVCWLLVVIYDGVNAT
jgi:hypothetical protein